MRESCIPEVDEVFENNMQNDSVPLTATLDNYTASLPGRLCTWRGSSPLKRDGSSTPNGPDSKFLRLFEQPFYAADDDLERMVNQLTRMGKERRSVKYLAAPSASGKTSCILPAFLKGKDMGSSRTTCTSPLTTTTGDTSTSTIFAQPRMWM